MCKNSSNQRQATWYKFKFISIYFHVYTGTTTGTGGADEGTETRSLPTLTDVLCPGSEERTQRATLANATGFAISRDINHEQPGFSEGLATYAREADGLLTRFNLTSKFAFIILL